MLFPVEHNIHKKVTALKLFCGKINKEMELGHWNGLKKYYLFL